jgi:hypothetical protein
MRASFGVIARTRRTADTVREGADGPLMRRCRTGSRQHQDRLSSMPDTDSMRTTTDRCDAILALIDECLAQYDATIGRGGSNAPVTTRPARHLHLVKR